MPVDRGFGRALAAGFADEESSGAAAVPLGCTDGAAGIDVGSAVGTVATEAGAVGVLVTDVDAACVGVPAALGIGVDAAVGRVIAYTAAPPAMMLAATIAIIGNDRARGVVCVAESPGPVVAVAPSEGCGECWGGRAPLSSTAGGAGAAGGVAAAEIGAGVFARPIPSALRLRKNVGAM